jgi:hypothetical protein
MIFKSSCPVAFGKKRRGSFNPTASAAYWQDGSQIQKRSSALVGICCPEISVTTNPTGSGRQWIPGQTNDLIIIAYLSFCRRFVLNPWKWLAIKAAVDS